MEKLTEKLPSKYARIIIGALIAISLVILCYPLLFLLAPVSALKAVLYPLWSMIDTLTTIVIGMTAFDVWLARAIAIALYSSVSFFFVGAIGNLVGVHKYLFRKERRALVVFVGCAICVSMYFISKGIHFSPITGEPLKKYYKHVDGRVDLFPIEMNFHPLYGDTLRLATKEMILAAATPPQVKPTVEQEQRKSVTDSAPIAVASEPKGQVRSTKSVTEVTNTKPVTVRNTIPKSTPPVPKPKPQPPPPPRSLEAGDRFSFDDKRVKRDLFLVGVHVITLTTIDLDERLRPRVTFQIENIGQQTSTLELTQPEPYIVDQNGIKYHFIESRNFPSQLPPGFPIQFSVTFGTIPISTRQLSVICRLGYYTSAPTPFGEDIVFRKLELKR